MPAASHTRLLSRALQLTAGSSAFTLTINAGGQPSSPPLAFRYIPPAVASIGPLSPALGFPTTGGAVLVSQSALAALPRPLPTFPSSNECRSSAAPTLAFRSAPTRATLSSRSCLRRRSRAPSPSSTAAPRPARALQTCSAAFRGAWVRATLSWCVPSWQSAPGSTPYPPPVAPPPPVSPGLSCGPLQPQRDRRHLLLRPACHPDQRFHGRCLAATALGTARAGRRGQPVAARPRGWRVDRDDYRRQLWRLEPEPWRRHVRHVCLDEPALRRPCARLLGRWRALPRRLGHRQHARLVDGHGHHGRSAAGHWST